MRSMFKLKQKQNLKNSVVDEEVQKNVGIEKFLVIFFKKI